MTAYEALRAEIAAAEARIEAVLPSPLVARVQQQSNGKWAVWIATPGIGLQRYVRNAASPEAAATTAIARLSA